jgi:hypothetical protein
MIYPIKGNVFMRFEGEIIAVFAYIEILALGTVVANIFYWFHVANIALVTSKGKILKLFTLILIFLMI